MKRLVFLVVWALAPGWLITAPAGAQTASFATQFYGLWYPYPLGNPNTGSVRYEFHHNAATGKDEMTVTRICPGEYPHRHGKSRLSRRDFGKQHSCAEGG